jgi:hypothetical protein
MYYLLRIPFLMAAMIGACSCHHLESSPKDTSIPSIVYTIRSGESQLGVDSLGPHSYGVIIMQGDSTESYQKAAPMEINVVTANGEASWMDSGYQRIVVEGNVINCSGTVVSPEGTSFRFSDAYRPYDDKGVFEVERQVQVSRAAAGDKGFSSRLAFHPGRESTVEDYDVFVPSIWYEHNAYVPANALAAEPGNGDYWFREDRLPLPLIMLRASADGTTFSLYHEDADGTTFSGESGLSRIIDGRMQFASMGMETDPRLLVGVLFPGSEGDHTGVGGYREGWAYRSSPVTEGYIQHYKVLIGLNREPDFQSAMKDTWAEYFGASAPSLYDCDLNEVYQSQITVLDHYWKNINGAPGFPFRILINGAVQQENDYNYNMGFVGMQIPNAALLIREGLKSGNADLLAKGEQIASWWSDNMFDPSNGSIRTWYDPIPQTWRTSYPTYMRVVGDGLGGLLRAWSFEMTHGSDKASWLAACRKGADWLVSHQGADGSFPRSVHYPSDAVQDHEKTNTSHVIPFLVDLYKVTGGNNYRQAALAAGDFIYDNSYQPFRYVGGTPDNPNVPDKEAASMALRAFLALYDLNGDARWLAAAKQAVYYYQTWVYAWNVPFPQDDPENIYPEGRSMTGLSVIATANNGSDTYAAIDAFNFYRMYLYTGDEQLLKMAELLERNTKQALNWDPAHPVAGYGPGMANEAINVTIPRGHGVGFYLPWQCHNYLEPMVRLKDVFGYFDIEAIQDKVSKTERASDNNRYAASRGLATSS